MRWWLATWGLLAGAAMAAQSAAPLPVTPLSAGMYLIQAEVARTPEQLQQGLMFRNELEDQHGMLFLFPVKGVQCMWMRNTLIPLSVAFLRDDGTIVNIEEMQAHSETEHCATEPVSLALEMNTGWFEKRGIRAGMRIRGIPAR